MLHCVEAVELKNPFITNKCGEWSYLFSLSYEIPINKRANILMYCQRTTLELNRTAGLSYDNYTDIKAYIITVN